MIALRFVAGESRPTARGKAPARRARSSTTRARAGDTGKLLGAVTRARAPRELARWDDLAGVPAFAETPVEGVPLTALLEPGATSATARTSELAPRMDRLAPGPRDAERHDAGRGSRRRLDELSSTPADRARSRWMVEASVLLDGVALVPVHGDLTPWNVFSAPTGLEVIDWEWSSAEGIPLADLTYFATTAALTIVGRKSDLDAVYRRLWTGGGRLGGRLPPRARSRARLRRVSNLLRRQSFGPPCGRATP